jgi:RHS repeat-associated protein
VELFLSDDNVIDEQTDYSLGEFPTPGLSSFSFFNLVQVPWRLPSKNLMGGASPYFIGMVVDSRNEIDESNELNNKNIGQGIDLDQITILSGPNIDAIPGDTIQFTAVADDGPGKATTAETFLLVNWGDLPLSVNELSFVGGAHFRLGNIFANPDGPVDLSAGPGQITENLNEIWVVEVIFDPSTTGTVNDTLRVRSNDPNEPEVLINLTGDGLPVPKLVITDSVAPSIDKIAYFGNVATDGAVGAAAVTLRNDGSGPLIVQQNGIVVSGGPFSIASVVSSTQGPINLASSPATMAAGATETWTVSLQFDPATIGLFEESLTIISNDSEHPSTAISLFGAGTGPPRIRVADSVVPFDDGVIAFPNIHVDGSGGISDTQSVTISNDGGIPLQVAQNGVTLNGGTHFRILNITSDKQGDIDLTSGPATIDKLSGETWTVFVAFDPVASGPQNDTLSIQSSDPNEPTLNVQLSGIGLVEPDIAVMDSIGPPHDLAVDFAPTLNDGAGNRTNVQTIAIANVGGQSLLVAQNGISLLGTTDFQIVGIESSVNGPVDLAGGGSSIDPLGAETWTVTIRFDPATTASRVATLRIENNDPDDSTVDVSLSGEGVIPIIQLTSLTQAINVSAGHAYRIKWSDAYGGGDAAIDLFYDTDTNPLSGLVPIASGLSEDDTRNYYDWQVPAALSGTTVTVYAVARDGGVTADDYAAGTLTIDAVGSDRLLSAPIVDSKIYTLRYEYLGEEITAEFTLVPGENTLFHTTSATLAGDYNRDGIADAADYVVWRKTLGSNVASYSGADGDGDGIVDEDDFDVWRANFSNTSSQLLPGDYNRDNKVDAADYVVWRKTLGNNLANYSGADGDGDGTVDSDDLGVWRANFGQTSPPGAGPVTHEFHVTFVPSLVDSEFFTYDELGNLTSSTDSSGQTTTFEYDALSRLAAIVLPDGATTKFTYDANGSLLSMQDASGFQLYNYDELDRLKKVTYSDDNQIGDPGDLSISYEYDLADRLTAIVYPSGKRIEYGYDAADRLTSVTEVGPNLVTTYDYSATTGLLTKATLPNDVETLYTYDTSGQLTDILHRRTSTAALIAKYHYNLDVSGRRSKVEVTTSSGTRAEAYEYDDFDRLEQVIYSTDITIDPTDRVVNYTYDTNGNRQSTTDNPDGTGPLPAEVNTYEYTFENRLERVTNQTTGEVTDYFYDWRGNQIMRVTPTETTHYSYDALNRLVAVDDRDDHIKYVYDGADRRIAQFVNGVETRFVIDPSSSVYQTIEERDSSGVLSAEYAYGLERLYGLLPGENNPTYYLHDALGSVGALTNDDGALLGTYEYDVFGQATAEPASNNNPFLFTGEHIDLQTGLIFLRARYMDPAYGIFLSKDPLGYFDGPNRFRYSSSNPTNYTDPTGQVPISDDDFQRRLENAYGRRLDAGVYRVYNNFGQIPAAATKLTDVLGLGEINLVAGHANIVLVNSQGRAYDLLGFYDDPKLNVIGGSIPKLTESIVSVERIDGVDAQSIVAADREARAGRFTPNSYSFLGNQCQNYCTFVIARAREFKRQRQLPINFLPDDLFRIFDNDKYFFPPVPPGGGGAATLVSPGAFIPPVSLPDITFPNLGIDPGGVELDEAATFAGAGLTGINGLILDPTTQTLLLDTADGQAPVLDVDLGYFLNFVSAAFGSDIPTFAEFDPSVGFARPFGDDAFSIFTADLFRAFVDYHPKQTDENDDLTYTVTFEGLPEITIRLDAHQIGTTSFGRPIMGLQIDSLTGVPAGWQVQLGTPTIEVTPIGQESIWPIDIIPDTTLPGSVTYSIASDLRHVVYGGQLVDTPVGWVAFEADRIMADLFTGVDRYTGQAYNSSTFFLPTGFRNLQEIRDDLGIPPGAVVSSRFFLEPDELILRQTIDPQTGEPTLRFDVATVRLSADTIPSGGQLDQATVEYVDFFTAHYDTFDDIAFPVTDPNDPTGQTIITVKLFDELRKVMKAGALARFVLENAIPIETWWGNSWQPPRAFTPGTVVHQGVPDNPATPAHTPLNFNFPLVGRDQADGALRLGAADLTFASPGSFDLTFERFYNSSLLGDELLGPGWQATRFELDFSRPRWHDPYQLFETPGGAPIEFFGPTADTRLRSGEVRVIDHATGQVLDFTSSLALSSSIDQNGDPIITLTGLDANGVPQFISGQRHDGSTLVQNADASRGYTFTRSDGSTIKFDADGNLTRIIDRHGYAIDYIRDAGGRLTGITDSAGQKLALDYDVLGRVQFVSGPEDTATPTRRVEYLYDVSGNLATVNYQTYQGGVYVTTQSVSYQYNSDNQLTNVIAPDGLNVLRTLPNLDGSSEVRTDVFGNAFNYDTLDNDDGTRTSTIVDAGLQSGNNPASHGIAALHFFPAGSAGSRTLDDSNRLVQVIDPLGNVTSFEYDNDSLFPNRIHLPMADREPIEIVRNAAGLPTQIIDPANTAGIPIRIQYNTANLPIQVDDAEGRTTKFSYTPSSNVQSITRGVGTPLASTTTFGYNPEDFLETVTNPLTQLIVTYSYDSLGRIRTVTDGTGVVTTFEYDPLSRLTRIYDPRLTGAVNFIQYDYNDNDQIELITTPTGTIDYEYDTLTHRLTSVTDLNGNATQYAYDPNTGQLARITQVSTSGNGVTQFEYDRLGNLVLLIAPEGHRTAFRHDALGRLTAVIEDDNSNPTALVNQQRTTPTTATFAIEASEPILVASLSYWVDGQPHGNGTTQSMRLNDEFSFGFELTGLDPAQQYQSELTLTDRVGRTAVISLPLLGTTPPVATVNALLTNDSTPPLSGRVDDLLATVIVAVAGNDYAVTNHGDGTWSLSDNVITPPLADGVYDVMVTVTGGQGGMRHDTTTNELTIDTTPPVITADTLVTTDRTPSLTGTLNDVTATVLVTVAGNSYAATNNGDGTWVLADNSITQDLSAGVYDVLVEATDAVGNMASDATVNELLVQTTLSESEFNDTITTSNDIGALSDDSITVSGSIDASVDLDFFTFTLSAPAGVFFDIDAQEIGLSGLDSVLTVFTLGGVPLGDNNDGYDFDGFVPNDTTHTPSSFDSALYLDMTAGTYAVGIKGFGNSSGAYKLTVQSNASYSASVPVLESNPGATDVLFLDFDGHASDTDLWAIINGPYSIGPFDFNDDPLLFSPAEQRAIENIWRMVSEDFSLLNLNVTTVDPGMFPDGEAYHLVIGGFGSQVGVGGVTSQIGALITDAAGDDVLGSAFLSSYINGGALNNVGFVFAEAYDTVFGVDSSTRIIAQAMEMGNTASHEFGHALGLRHYGGSNQKPNGIMQTPEAGVNRERWQTGNTHSDEPPVQFQDDVATIGSHVNTIGLRPDDHGDDANTATSLGGTEGTQSADGILHDTTDVDYFRFFADGLTAVRVVVDDYVANIDTELYFYDVAGNLIASDDAAGSLGAQLNLTLLAGAYLAEVRSNGGEGEAGQYRLEVSTSPFLPGDYNLDGSVDAADYVVWRKTVGNTVANYSGADGDGNGIVGQGDFAVWRANFGETLAPSGPGLLGDYQNVVVDRGDYVVSRKTPGAAGVPAFSGADRAGDVGSHHLVVWKAHFGETLPSPGSGAAAASSLSMSSEVPQKTISALLATVESLSATASMADPSAGPAFEIVAALPSVTAPRETIVTVSRLSAATPIAKQDPAAWDQALVDLGHPAPFATEQQTDSGSLRAQNTRLIFAPAEVFIPGRESNIAPRRTHRTLAAGRAMRAEHLLLSASASVIDDEPDAEWTSARAGREHKEIKHDVLDNVFSDLGRSLSRRHRVRTPLAVS